MMGWYHDGSWGPGGWLLMTLSMTVVWGAVIAVLVMLFRFDRRTTPASGSYPWPARDPERLLGERFARGDIDETEYRLRLEVLRGSITASTRTAKARPTDGARGGDDRA